MKAKPSDPPMRLLCVFALRKDVEDTPELLLAWDEFCADSNYEGFEQERERVIRACGDDLAAVGDIEIEVDMGKIVGILKPSGNVEGKVVAK